MDLSLENASWSNESGWIEEPFEDNALTSDKERFTRTQTYSTLSRPGH